MKDKSIAFGQPVALPVGAIGCMGKLRRDPADRGGEMGELAIAPERDPPADIAGKASTPYVATELARTAPMSTLTITAKGQVTLKKELLRHLGVKPGDKVEIDLLPEGAAMLRTVRPKGSIEDFFGCLKDEYDGPALTIDEINEVIAKGWAGEL